MLCLRATSYRHPSSQPKTFTDGIAPTCASLTSLHVASLDTTWSTVVDRRNVIEDPTRILAAKVSWQQMYFLVCVLPFHQIHVHDLACVSGVRQKDFQNMRIFYHCPTPHSNDLAKTSGGQHHKTAVQQCEKRYEIFCDPPYPPQGKGVWLQAWLLSNLYQLLKCVGGREGWGGVLRLAWSPMRILVKLSRKGDV